MVLEAIRAHCLQKSGAWEDNPWGDTVWKVGKKMFCAGGGKSVTVKSTLDKQAALVMHPNIEVAAYVGRYGWVSISIDDQETLELALELIDESYESVARNPSRARQ